MPSAERIVQLHTFMGQMGDNPAFDVCRADMQAQLEEAKAERRAALPPRVMLQRASIAADKAERKLARLSKSKFELAEKLEAVDAELQQARVEQAAAGAELHAAKAQLLFSNIAAGAQAAIGSRIQSCKAFLASLEGYQAHGMARGALEAVMVSFTTEV